MNTYIGVLLMLTNAFAGVFFIFFDGVTGTLRLHYTYEHIYTLMIDITWNKIHID